MNVETGEIKELRELLGLEEEERKKYKEMVIPPTQTQRKTRKVGRNDPCPCGSGVKFKRCCFKGRK